MFSYAMLEMANKIHENINAVPTAFLGITVCALMHKDAIQHRSGLRDEALEMNAFVNFLPIAFRHTCCLACTVSEIPIVVIKRKETLSEREDRPGSIFASSQSATAKKIPFLFRIHIIPFLLRIHTSHFATANMIPLLLRIHTSQVSTLLVHVLLCACGVARRKGL